MKQYIVSGLILVFSILNIQQAAAENKTLPVPPMFNLNSSPEALLNQYPLGVISKTAAFSHHGGAHRKITLPNGHEGWVYNIGDSSWHRTYTLVIDKADLVSDVLYYDHAKNNEHGLSALQFQSKNLIVGKSRHSSGPE